ncbi:MAG: outer membrane beta-barrel protein [Bacteroidota bacterium]
MRELLTYIFVFSCMTVYGQKKDLSEVVNELDISVNRTISTRYSEYNERFGIGVGAKHIFFKPKKLNLVTGMEYNMNRFHIDNIYEGHWSYSKDVDYTLHNLSIPLYARWNVGNKIKFFLEAGGFLDFIVAGKRSGTRHTSSSNLTGEKVFEFEDDGDIYSVSYGTSMGFGVSFPLENYSIFIKPDCRIGFADLSYYSYVTNSSLRINIGIQL